jgi:hypothetical protein
MAEMAETHRRKQLRNSLRSTGNAWQRWAAPQDLKIFQLTLVSGYGLIRMMADHAARLGYRHKDPLTSVWAKTVSFMRQTESLPPDTIELVPTPETVEAIGLRYKAEEIYEAWKLSQYIKFGVTERGYDTMLCRQVTIPL